MYINRCMYLFIHASNYVYVFGAGYVLVAKFHSFTILGLIDLNIRSFSGYKPEFLISLGNVWNDLHACR